MVGFGLCSRFSKRKKIQDVQRRIEDKNLFAFCSKGMYLEQNERR